MATNGTLILKSGGAARIKTGGAAYLEKTGAGNTRDGCCCCGCGNCTQCNETVTVTISGWTIDTTTCDNCGGIFFSNRFTAGDLNGTYTLTRGGGSSCAWIASITLPTAIIETRWLGDVANCLIPNVLDVSSTFSTAVVTLTRLSTTQWEIVFDADIGHGPIYLFRAVITTTSGDCVSSASGSNSLTTCTTLHCNGCNPPAGAGSLHWSTTGSVTITP